MRRRIESPIPAPESDPNCESLTPSIIGWKNLFLLTGFILILTVVWIGKPEIVTRGEGREALVARSLYEQGELILPRGYGGVVPSKPPALHWLIGASSSLVGEINEFTCRLPSAISALLFILFLASWIARRDLKRVWPTVIVLAASFEWLRASVSCRVDMLHAAALAGAVILGSGINPLLSSNRMRWFAVVALSLVSTLTKGPVGALLPAAILLISGYWEHRRLLLSFVYAGSVALGALNLAAIWYLAAFFQGGSEFIDKVSYENVQRFMSTMDDSPHRHSVWYLLGMGILGLMPWSLPFIGQFVWFVFRGRKGTTLPGIGEADNIVDLVNNNRQLEKPSRQVGWLKLKLDHLKTGAFNGWSTLITEPESRLSIVAILVLFTFYAIPSGKRGVYLLAAYPFAAILIGRAFCELHRVREKISKVLKNILKLLVIVMASIILSGYILGGDTISKIYAQLSSLFRSPVKETLVADSQLDLGGIFSQIGHLEILIVVLIVCGLYFSKRLSNKILGKSVGDSAFGEFAIVYALLLIVAQAVVFPAATNSLGIKEIAKRLDEATIFRGMAFGSDVQSSYQSDNQTTTNQIYSYGSEWYSVAFYSKNEFKSASTMLDSAAFKGFKDGTILVMERRYLNKFKDRLAELSNLNDANNLESPETTGCLKIGEILDFKQQEGLVKGKLIMVRITCKSHQ